MTTKTHTNTGKTAGSSAEAADFGQIIGTPPTYADDGTGNIVIQSPTTAIQAQLLDTMSSSQKVLSFTTKIRFLAAPSGVQEIMQGRAIASGQSSVKSGNMLHNVVNSNPTLQPRGGGDATLTGWASSQQLVVGTQYLLEIQIDIGTTTTNGRMRARLTRISDGVVIISGENTALNNLNNSLTASTVFGAAWVKPNASQSNNIQWDDTTVTDELPYGTYAAAASDPASQNKIVEINDGVGIADTGAQQVTNVGYSNNDNVPIGDLVAAVRQRLVALSDGVGITDATIIDRSTATTGTRADSLAIGDLLVQAAQRPRSNSDLVGITDQLVVARNRVVNLADSVAIDDVETIILARSSEGFTLTYFDGEQEYTVGLEFFFRLTDQ